MKSNILILGSNGMVGQALYKYLSSTFPENVWGTTRNREYISRRRLYLDVTTYKKNFKSIFKQLKRIDYVINCIGITNNLDSREDLIIVNSFFPHALEELAERDNFKLIHISTDAVFSPLSGIVNESSPIGPVDYYGSSKLLGETVSMNAITFRSSFIGFDSSNHRGLLEWVLKSSTIYGYTKYKWSGSTTLQFANLCDSIIKNNAFPQLRKKSPLFHFSPIKPVSKYTLIKTFINIINGNQLLKIKKNVQSSRVLISNHKKLLFPENYTVNIEQALRDLVEHESELIKSYGQK